MTWRTRPQGDNGAYRGSAISPALPGRGPTPAGTALSDAPHLAPEASQDVTFTVSGQNHDVSLFHRLTGKFRL
mgnify:CR=1 FL=1